MNILIDDLPEALEVGGRAYPINTDFRSCLRTIMACEDKNLTGHEKAIVILTNLYPEIPDDFTAALEQALLFLDGGKNQQEPEERQPRVYSFAKDANFIFAAFRQTHRVDLQVDDMHWWKFIALFMDVGSETTFSQLTSLRKRVKTGKATKQEREAAKQLGDIFHIEETETRTLDDLEVEDEFMKAWNTRQSQET